MPRPNVISIDGPVASGKTAVGKLLSQSLNYRFLDTGSLYRAITWVALRRGVEMQDDGLLGKLAQDVTIRVKEQDMRTVTVDGEDVTGKLHVPEIDEHVSRVSQVLEVRSSLMEQQRAMARDGRIVMAGRDIGTVVLPEAEMKLFLMAPSSERALRRYHEMMESGERANYEQVLYQVLYEVEERDRVDTERIHSPLQPAPDAHLIDTEGMNVDEVVKRVLELMEDH